MTTTDRRWSEATRELVRPVLALYLGSDYLHLDDATDAILDAMAGAGLLADGMQEIHLRETVAKRDELRERLDAAEEVGERLAARVAELEQALTAGEASDGHHTHNELYEYRMLYHVHAARGWVAAGIPVFKSWRHHDGEECFGGGWFIVTATLPSGQVSNHYQAEHWDLFAVPAVELPPEWDGHTPAEASDRLRAHLELEQPGRWELPAEPGAEVQRAWDRNGDQWCRLSPTLPGERNWVPADTIPDEGHIEDAAISWRELLIDYGPLSATPPGKHSGSGPRDADIPGQAEMSEQVSGQAHATEPGCSTCGTCMDHDGCADDQFPLRPGDCVDCGACAACIARCARARQATPPETAGGGQDD